MKINPADVRVTDKNIFVIENLVSPEDCEFLIREAEFKVLSGLTSIGTYDSSGQPVTGWPARNVEMHSNIYGPHLEVLDKIDKLVKNAVSECTSESNPPNGGYVGMPISVIHRWTKGDFMGRHSDAYGSQGIKYGIVLYLNGTESYSGGNLYYPDLELCLTTKAGTLVVHSGDITHEVLPVLSGIRYSMTGFYYENGKAPSYVQ